MCEDLTGAKGRKAIPEHMQKSKQNQSQHKIISCTPADLHSGIAKECHGTLSPGTCKHLEQTRNLSLSLFLQGEGGGKLQAAHPTQLTFKRSRAHNTPMCSDCVYTWSLLAQNQTELHFDIWLPCHVIDSHPCHRHEKHVQSSQGHIYSHTHVLKDVSLTVRTCLHSCRDCGCQGSRLSKLFSVDRTYPPRW